MRLLITALLLCITLQSSAQGFLEELSRKVCECVTEKGISQDKECMQEYMADYMDHASALYGGNEEYQQTMLITDMTFHFADCPVLNEKMIADAGVDMSGHPWLRDKDCKKGFKGKYYFTDMMSGETVTAEFDGDRYSEAYTDQIVNFSVEWDGCNAALTVMGGSGEGYSGNDEGSTYNMTFKRGNKKALDGVIFLPIFGDIMPLPRFYTSAD